ncbi:MAG: hypothetical protein M3Z87_00010 [Lactobacillus sp.]|nr:hypothetical protein [Lactobacillus sp.]
MGNKKTVVDPALVKMLAEKNITYDEWASETIWGAFREAIENHNSPFARQILEVAGQRVKDEYINSRFN